MLPALFRGVFYRGRRREGGGFNVNRSEGRANIVDSFPGLRVSGKDLRNRGDSRARGRGGNRGMTNRFVCMMRITTEKKELRGFARVS